jgi:DNA-binding response OmpR family regulator
MNTRILIIEDDPAIGMALRDDLELESYQAELCSGGEEGARKALTEAFDLVLLDIGLPGKSGLDVCREVRAAKPDLPVILLTARSSEAEKVLGLEMGADDYVTKPFSPLELRARVKALLRRSARSESQSQTFGEFEVDFHRMELRHGEAVISLMNDRWRTEVVVTTDASGVAETVATHGDYVVEWDDGSRLRHAEIVVRPGEPAPASIVLGP